MKFSDLYKNDHSLFSIEVFPPKTSQGTEKLFLELKQLESIKPAYVSVTYGAMGSTRHLTRDLVLKIHNELKVNVAFHFTCIGSDKEEIKKYATDLKNQGVHLVLALRGDKPSADYQSPPNGFQYAEELVSYLHSLHDFSIAVAGYPEKHTEAASIESDLENLKRKVDAGADIIITQLFFDNALYFRWLDKVHKIGIRVPVIAGIMPILNLHQIDRITKICGAKLPKSLVSQLEKAEHDENLMRQIGIEHATLQCENLIQNKVSGIHFYCLNHAYSTLQVTKNLFGPLR